MTDFPWLTTLAVVPLAGAVAVAAVPRGRELFAKQLALVVALVVLVSTVLMALQFDTAAGDQLQFVESVTWIERFGISYSVGVDGIALVLICLLVTLVPIAIVSDWTDADDTGRRPQTFFALMLALESVVVVVFAATDLFLFYVAFEVMLIPIYFLIGMYGRGQRSYAAVKFLLYSLLGGLVLLAGVIGLYAVGVRELGTGTFSISQLATVNLDPTTERWLFIAFFVAFAIKAPMVPVHTWLPDATASGTPGTNTLLVGVLDKVGTFAMIRLVLPLFPDASRWAAPVVVTLAVLSVVYAGLVAIGQRDLNRLVAYVSVSHFGFIVLGIFAFTQLGGAGSTFYMVAHGLSAAAMFVTVGFFARRRGSALVDEFGGVARVAPVAAGVLLMSGLASLALPGLAGFVGELTALVGAYARWPVAAVVAVVGIVLSALYVLLMYKRVAQGPRSDNVSSFGDLVPREIWAVAPALALTIALGVYPQAIFDPVNPAVQQVLDVVDAPAVTPATPVSEGAQQ